MGKNFIDSATMMNKVLVIETQKFLIRKSKIKILIHDNHIYTHC